MRVRMKMCTKEGERTTRMYAARKENETKHGFDSSGSG